MIVRVLRCYWKCLIQITIFYCSRIGWPQIGKYKMDRLGRYMDRSESRKNVLNSWDRDLSVGEVKWSIGRKSKLEKDPRDKNGPKIDARVLLEKHVFWWFGAGFGLWELDFCSQNIFLSRFWWILTPHGFGKILVFSFWFFRFCHFFKNLDFDEFRFKSGCHPIREQ